MDFSALMNAVDGCEIEIMFPEGIRGARGKVTPRLRLMN
jgi:hypothetical protein